MANNPQPTRIPFQILSVSTEQFAVLPNNHHPGADDHQVMSGLDFQADPDQRHIFVIFTAEYRRHDAPYIILTVAVAFGVDEAHWQQLLQNDQSLLLPRGFVLHLATIVVGTARGILHTRLTGSPFAHYVLPTINLTEIVKGDIPVIPVSTAEGQ